MAQAYVLLLRFLHIVLGVFWIGSGLFVTFFLQPAVAASGESGGKLMSKLGNSPGFQRAFPIAAGLTVLSGILLYVRNWWPLLMSGQATGPAYGFLIGGLFGLAGMIMGAAVIGRTTREITKLGDEIAAAAGGPPPPEKVSRMAALQDQLHRAERIDTLLLIIAVILMSISRYLTF
jgi:uncharacterized membrane protein